MRDIVEARDYGNAVKLQSDWCRPVQGAGTTPCIASHQTLSPRVRVWLRETSGTAWQELETTLPRSSKIVATTSWTAYKSGKVIQTLADGDHFVIAPFAPDPFYLHSNKPLPEFIYFLFITERRY